jgi:hypothetical protein
VIANGGGIAKNPRHTKRFEAGSRSTGLATSAIRDVAGMDEH